VFAATFLPSRQIGLAKVVFGLRGGPRDGFRRAYLRKGVSRHIPLPCAAEAAAAGTRSSHCKRGAGAERSAPGAWAHTPKIISTRRCVALCSASLGVAIPAQQPALRSPRSAAGRPPVAGRDAYDRIEGACDCDSVLASHVGEARRGRRHAEPRRATPGHAGRKTTPVSPLGRRTSSFLLRVVLQSPG